MVLALTEIWRRVVKIKTNDKDALIPFGVMLVSHFCSHPNDEYETSHASPRFNRKSVGTLITFTKALKVTASERRGNSLKQVEDFDLKVKARIWPWLSYMSDIRSTVETR